MTQAPTHALTRKRVLPVGGNGSLWAARPAYGIFEFRGRRLRIEVTDPTEVLFPTDCGLSLVAALDGEHGLDLQGVRALDIGCGSGLYTVALLAAGAAHVTALDINAASEAETAANVARNGLDMDRLSCVTADLTTYAPGRTFDLVVTNPPHLPYDPSYATDNGLETALVAGRNGRLLYDAVVARIDDLLAPGGRLIMAHSSLADVPRTIADLELRGYEWRALEACEMDIPLLAYAEHKETMLGLLEAQRELGSADFEGERFTVHALEFRRPSRADARPAHSTSRGE
ncbi:methyltransferase [Streptomyces sp. SID685]|uniref:methyltransferase domain-containing protein n=1 Tax=Streptomyces TaxID=1883 RepID=UPI0013706D2F|nr:methyltransferase domain-containing protein [Streptomyces sp. SID685]MYR89628.1 methyltransferase [Streptomyces sp. SID685]